MIVCESQFRIPDRNNPAIALHEVDFYQAPDMRLSLRYRFNPGEYEVYSKDFRTTYERIIFKDPDLQAALDAGGKAWKQRFGGDQTEDIVCTHEFPLKAFGCKEVIE